MNYHADPNDVELTPGRPRVQRVLGDAVGQKTLAGNQYEVLPGESIPLAYRHHGAQEEAVSVAADELRIEAPEHDSPSTPARCSP